MEKITYEAVFQALKALGITCRKTAYGEYAVYKSNATSTEGHYYTDDLKDAYKTGLTMHIDTLPVA